MSKTSSWFDESTHVSLIADKAKELESFVSTFADGKVDISELKAQEQRVFDLMKEIEPQLDEKLHARLTELLCELTAYDFMQFVFALQESKPETKFEG
jgi:arginine decarboxylase-like protein